MFEIVTLGLLAWFLWMFAKQHFIYTTREKGRIHPEHMDIMAQLQKQFNMILVALGNQAAKKQTVSYQAAKAEKEMARKLRMAGLETAAEQGRFFLIRVVSSVTGPLLGLCGYTVLPAYYATLLMLTCSAIGIVAPMLWLRGKILNRTEDIQRELPLLLDLTNLGTSAGWDVAASLEKVIDALAVEFPSHPLIKEFRRAKWLTASGYTWREALERLGKKLDNDSVRRATLALTQALKQGGDRSSQLEGIADDAQRTYYGELDKRLASLPVKAIFVTMLLMMSYFVILLSPAAVGIKRSLTGV